MRPSVFLTDLYGGYIPLIKNVKIGEKIMICFDRLWQTMKEKNISTYQLREHCGIDSKTIRRLRANENIETKTLNKLCSVLKCRIEEIAEYQED